MNKIVEWGIIKFSANKQESIQDELIVEEPLEIKLFQNGHVSDLAVTMRTPGHDFELSTGFLFTEGIIHSSDDIAKISFDASANETELQSQSITVYLHSTVDFDPTSLQRHFYSTSSCGVCGKSSIDMVKQEGMYLIKKNQPLVSNETLYSLSRLLQSDQNLFSSTGGNHASALFNVNGRLEITHEDVGRHNAVDKVIGQALKQARLPLNEHGLLVSGRAGFELVQKAWMAGIGLFVAIGAPSSLAVELADEVGMTLIGFLGEERFNVYTHAGRVI